MLGRLPLETFLGARFNLGAGFGKLRQTFLPARQLIGGDAKEQAGEVSDVAKPDRLARPPQPPPPRRRRPPNRSGQKEFGKKKSAAARPKARAGSAAALARARKSPKAG
jgi:hypothetical protein